MLEISVEQEGANVARVFPEDCCGISNLPDRRKYAREHTRFAYLDFGDGDGAAILDVSEGGLAVQSVHRLDQRKFSKVRFRLSKTARWVEAGGKFVWMNHSKKIAGIEFVRISAEARNQIRNRSQNVMSRNAALGAFSAVEPFFVTQRIATDAPPPDAPASRPGNRSRDTSARVRRPLISLLTKAAVLTIGLVLIGPYWAGSLLEPQLRKLSVPSVDVKPSPLPDFPIQTAGGARAAASARPELPRGTQTSVLSILQVATMRHKENAEALSSVLRSKGFPVLIFQPDSGYFFVVVAGPFSGTNSLNTARAALKEQGFEAIARPWPRQ
jgi:cell division septation protein DedD